MTYQEVLEQARTCMGKCHACPVCNGLAVEPVQSHKNHISLLADIQNSQSDDGGILPFSRCAHSAKIRSNPVKYHRLQFRKRIKKLFRMCENILSELLQSKEHIHKDCLMPPGPERSANLGS